MRREYDGADMLQLRDEALHELAATGSIGASQLALLEAAKTVLPEAKWDSLLTCGRWVGQLACSRCGREKGRAGKLLCRTRWLCLSCEGLMQRETVERWLGKLIAEHTRHQHIVDTDVPLLRWRLREQGDVEKARQELAAFGLYARRTFRGHLQAHGVGPGWIMPARFDPAGGRYGEVRAAFFGPVIDPERVPITARIFSCNISTYENMSAVITNLSKQRDLDVNLAEMPKTTREGQRGFSTAWTCRMLGRLRCRKSGARVTDVERAAYFQKMVREALHYVVGNVSEAAAVDPERAAWCYRIFKGSQLNKTYGLYSRATAPVAEDEPAISFIYRKYGGEVWDEIDAKKLYGSWAEKKHECVGNRAGAATGCQCGSAETTLRMIPAEKFKRL